MISTAVNWASAPNSWNTWAALGSGEKTYHFHGQGDGSPIRYTTKAAEEASWGPSLQTHPSQFTVSLDISWAHRVVATMRHLLVWVLIPKKERKKEMELLILFLLPWELLCPGGTRIRLCIRSYIFIAASLDEEPTVEEGNEKLWERWQIVVGVKESVFLTCLVEEKNISINVYNSLMCRKIWLYSSRKASSGNKKN